jgi:hypothetical protein
MYRTPITLLSLVKIAGCLRHRVLRPVGLRNKSAAKCTAQLWFWLGGILCSFSKSSQQHIFARQRLRAEGILILNLQKPCSLCAIMKAAVFTILYLFLFSDSNCQTKESLRDYFFPKTNKADTLYFDSQRYYGNNKKVVKHISTDTIEVSEFSGKGEFERSYTYLISENYVNVISSKTNLNGKQIINNELLGRTWLSLQKDSTFYDGRCDDTTNEKSDPFKGYWEWENRQQLSFKFDTVLHHNIKRKALIVNFKNYLLNQPRFISSKINFMSFKETMTFVEGIGLTKISQNGIDHIHPKFSFSPVLLLGKKPKRAKPKKKNDYSFTNVIVLRAE